MTISYRSVVFGVLSILALAVIILYFMFPDSPPSRYMAEMSDRLISRLDSNGRGKVGIPGAQQAHFTAVEGTVKVKKSSSNVWINAEYNIPLERGDVVQTSSEGMAKLVFTDGTN